MSAHAVRQKFVKEFRSLESSSRLVAGLIVGSYTAQVLAAMGFGFWLLQQPQSFLTMTALAVNVFFIATRLRGFNNIVHECSHFAFTRRREDNVVIGSICASLVLSCYRDYRDEHLTHHAHLGDYEKDLDLQGIRDFKLEDPLTPKTILRHVLTPLLCLHLPCYVSINLSPRDGQVYRVLKLGLIVAAVIFLLLDPVAALLLVWLPFLWGYTAINYWTDCIDHGGIVTSGDELEASRNVTLPKPLRAILFPRNDCFHLIHHLFPQVPANHFDGCHERLLSDPAYRARAIGNEVSGAVPEVKTKSVDTSVTPIRCSTS